MNKEELTNLLEQHRLWLNDEGGKRADLRGACLEYADLRGARLEYVDLRGACLEYADLRGANLRGANLRGANLQEAKLNCANLEYANLRGANLRGANIDFISLPLWCGGLNFKIDKRQAKQLLYHIINLMQYSGINTSKIFKKNAYKWLEDSHLVTNHHLPIIKEKENE